MIRLTTAVTALFFAVELMMSIGSVNANVATLYDPEDWGFTEIGLSVFKDNSELHGIRFKFNMDDLDEIYQCKADLQSNSLTVSDYQI